MRGAQLLLLGAGVPEQRGCGTQQPLLLGVELLVEAGEDGAQVLLLGAGSPGQAGGGENGLQLLLLGPLLLEPVARESGLQLGVLLRLLGGGEEGE